MSNPQYKNIGKKQIINVVSQMIQKVEAIEVTLNLLIMFVDKDDKFNDFMKEKLQKAGTGGEDESSEDEGDNPKGDIATDNKDS
jgi:hypothetical protein